MATLDGPMGELALEMIDEHGLVAELSRPSVNSGGAYDPATGTMPAPTIAPLTVKAFLEGFTAYERLQGNSSNRECKALIAGRSIPDAWGRIKNGDLLKLSDRTLRVEEVDSVYSGEQIALYQLLMSENRT